MANIEGMAGKAARGEGFLDFVDLRGREGKARAWRHASEHLLKKRIGLRGQKHADF